MRKSKFLMIIAFLLLGITGATAQDASNNATWMETIDFINENSNYLNSTTEDNYSKWVFSNWNITQYFLLKGNTRYYDTDELIFDWNFEIDLRQLKDVRVIIKDAALREDMEESDKDFRLTFTGKYVVRDKDEKLDNYFLSVENSEMFPRILKAFKHLTYLANTKRQLESKF